MVKAKSKGFMNMYIDLFCLYYHSILVQSGQEVKRERGGRDREWSRSQDSNSGHHEAQHVGALPTMLSALTIYDYLAMSIN